MKYKKLKLCAVLLLGLGLTGLQAQESLIHESLTATGGDVIVSGGGSVTYSVGQVTYTTYTGSGTNGSVAQGVQQPFEISTQTGVEEARGISLMISAYPNPTTDYLILKVENFELSTLHFQLIDMNGKLLQNEKILSNQTNVAMSSLVPATYFLKVTDVNKVLKTFKIIKN